MPAVQILSYAITICHSLHLHGVGCLCDIAKQLYLEDVLPLLVLLGRLKRLVVLPAHRLMALTTCNIAHDMIARGHLSGRRFTSHDIDDVAEEVCFAVLTTEVLRERQRESGVFEEDVGKSGWFGGKRWGDARAR